MVPELIHPVAATAHVAWFHGRCQVPAEWEGEAWLWHDRAEQRLYAVEQYGPRRAERLNLADALAVPRTEGGA